MADTERQGEEGLVKMLAEAEIKNQHLDRVLRSYAHDIRNNIGGIQGLAELTYAEAESSRNSDGSYSLNQEGLENIRDIANIASESLEMSKNYLDLARIENGTYVLNPEHFNFMGTIHEAVRDVSSKQKKTIGVEYSTLERTAITDFTNYKGEKTKIKTIIQNLVRNAYEAAPEGTKVRIYFGSEEGKLLVMIANKGTIPAELRDPEKLFSFGTTSGKTGGNGIGTYTAKMFAKAHKGDILFHTSDDSNSTQFTLSLPKELTA